LNKDFIRKNKWILVILFAALAVRMLYFVNIKPWDRNYSSGTEGYGDALEYQAVANKIIETGTYPENFFLDTYRTPGFPIYIAGIYYIFGVKPHYVLFSYIFLSVLTVLFIYLISKKLFDNNIIALFAAALFALEPNTIKLVTEFGTESLHGFLLIAAFYFLISGLKNEKAYIFILSAVIFGLAALTRPVNLYFYIICLALIVFYPQKKYLYKMKFALLFGLVYFLTITPWMYRNYRTYGHFSTNAFQGTAVYYNAILVKAYAEKLTMDTAMVKVVNDVNNICEEKKLTNPFDIDREKEIYGYNYINEHKTEYAVLHAKGMINFFAAPLNNENYSFSNKLVIGIYLGFIYVFSFVGIISLLKRKYYFLIASFLSVIFYFWFVTGILGLSRYRLPATLFYIIFCAAGIYYTSEYVKLKLLNKKI